eukprot:TRINITY_DN65549_c9_g2_i2.p2 TRINITY_DN65549_c9_g2~~TRINITY_DN65549_c9_g2_i2.p2  ORF type:complete len:105 (+),score=10.13 TRINITY_DN65549_c9_g2_i2:290-604(+)
MLTSFSVGLMPPACGFSGGSGEKYTRCWQISIAVECCNQKRPQLEQVRALAMEFNIHVDCCCKKHLQLEQVAPPLHPWRGSQLCRYELQMHWDIHCLLLLERLH